MSGSERNKKKFHCGNCDEDTKGTVSTSIWCGICETYWHIKCIKGMTYEFVDTCEKLNKIYGGSSYLCTCCRKIIGKMSKTVQEIEAKMTKSQQETETRMSKMENDLKTAELERDALKQRLENMETKTDQVKDKVIGVEKEIEAGMEKAKTEMTQEMAKEMREREGRNENIVVYGVTESEKEGREEKEKEDKEKVMEMAKQIGVEIRGDVEVKFRAGKKKEDDTIPRPLVVKIPDEETREKILDQARFLAKRDGWDKVYVAPDMTWKQREEAKKEEAEMKEEAERKTEEARAEGKKGKFAVIGRRGRKRMVWWEERERDRESAPVEREPAPEERE